MLHLKWEFKEIVVKLVSSQINKEEKEKSETLLLICLIDYYFLYLSLKYN